MQNGTQRGSYNAKRHAEGYTLTPFDNVSCGVALSPAVSRIVLGALREVLQSGKCNVSFSKPPVGKVTADKKLRFKTKAQIDYACVVNELKTKLKEMSESGKIK
jgi:hypothetical protein